MAFPSPEKLSFSLTTARRMPGRRAASSISDSSMSLLALEVLEPLRQGDAGLAEHLAAAGLGAEVGEIGVGAVERDAEQDGELALERRRVEDGEVGARAVLDPLADALDQPRALEDLLGQRARRGVVGAEQRQARPGVAGGDAGEELEVVVQDHRVHRLRGDVDDARPRVAQPDQEEEQPLFVEAGAGELAQLALVEGHRRHDHRGVRRLVLHGEGVPDLEQLRLEELELGPLGLGAEIGGEGGLWDHGRFGLNGSRGWAPRPEPAAPGPPGLRAGRRPARAIRPAAASGARGGSAAAGAACSWK